MSGRQRDKVSRLAALLRIADGLDREHAGAVKVDLRVGEGRHGDHRGERSLDLGTAAALKKADLFQEVFGLKVAIR